MKEKKENEQWQVVYEEEGKKIVRPAWITDDLIERTKVWQEYSKKPLSESELLEMIVGVGFLVDRLHKKS